MGKRAWLWKNIIVVIELIVVAGFCLVSVFGHNFTKESPTHQILARVREAPNPESVLGRDELGRDILARLIYGSRYTVGVGFGTVVFGLAIGGTLGLIAGYFGKQVDNLIMRIMDLALAFPSILLAIVLISVLGPGIVNVVVAVGITFVPHFARLTRSQSLKLREEQYIEAAKSMGASDVRIIFQHILPNALPVTFVQATYSLAEGIITVAGLGFLGLGVQPPTPEWGVMLSRAREVMFTSQHVVIMPGLALVSLLIIVNMLGDSLRDIGDPWLSRSR